MWSDILEKLKPACVAPVVVFLCHESCPENGGIFEAAGGWVGKYRLQRSRGKVFIPLSDLTPEGVKNSWDQITDFTQVSYPTSTQGEFNDLYFHMDSISGSVLLINDCSLCFRPIQSADWRHFRRASPIRFSLVRSSKSRRTPTAVQSKWCMPLLCVWCYFICSCR